MSWGFYPVKLFVCFSFRFLKRRIIDIIEDVKTTLKSSNKSWSFGFLKGFRCYNEHLQGEFQGLWWMKSRGLEGGRFSHGINMAYMGIIMLYNHGDDGL